MKEKRRTDNNDKTVVYIAKFFIQGAKKIVSKPCDRKLTFLKR